MVIMMSTSIQKHPRRKKKYRFEMQVKEIIVNFCKWHALFILSYLCLKMYQQGHQGYDNKLIFYLALLDTKQYMLSFFDRVLTADQQLEKVRRFHSKPATYK